MRGIIVATGAALAGIAIGSAAPAWAAPSGPGSADEVISELEDHGVIVIIEERHADVPLDRARVLGMRPGENYRRLPGDVIYLDIG